ncbi:hypothetical protein COE30_11205 [Bacillus cereus]|nr:hypothetical protein COE30_11205 [Bacillus cereus]
MEVFICVNLTFFINTFNQYMLHIELGLDLISLLIIEVSFTSNNENYVNKLSTWVAYFIFPHSVGYFAKCW